VGRLVASKDSEIANLNKRIDACEGELSRLRSLNDSTQRKLSDREIELKRSNEEYEHVKSKNETLQKVIYKQEESIKDLEKTCKELKNNLDLKVSELHLSEDKVKAKDSEISTHKEKIEDANKLIENNKQMIAWLNTQVSEQK